MNKNWFIICAIVLIVTMISPIFFYQQVFGWGLWQTHEEWAQMGSALSGLYTPILSLLTLIVLIIQLFQSNRERNFAICMSTIANLTEQGKENVNTLSVDMQRTLSEVVTDEAIKLTLISLGKNDDEAFDSAKVTISSKEIGEMTYENLLLKIVNSSESESDENYLFFKQLLVNISLKPLAKWMGFNSALVGLYEGASHNKATYQWKNSAINLMGSASSTLGYGVCVSLDKWTKECHRLQGREYKHTYFLNHQGT